MKLVLAAFAFLSIAAAQQAYQPAAVWEWSENVITNPADQAAFFTFAASHGVNRVYIECESAVQNNQPALIGFLEAAATNRIVTELLFGDAHWVTPGAGYPHQGYAISLVSTYTAQLLGKMTTGKPVAVHFDVEPYSLKTWKKRENALANDYVSLVTQLATAAHNLGLTLSVDVPYWYSTIPVTQTEGAGCEVLGAGKLSSNGRTGCHESRPTAQVPATATPMNQLVIQAVDTYVIMDYWDTTARIESQATTDMNYADGIPGKQVVIGVLTSCKQVPQNTSFCNTTSQSGTAVMETVLGQVNGFASAYPSFSGLAIEDYAGFSILAP